MQTYEYFIQDVYRNKGVKRGCESSITKGAKLKLINETIFNIKRQVKDPCRKSPCRANRIDAFSPFMISLQGNKLCKASSGLNLALMSSFLLELATGLWIWNSTANLRQDLRVVQLIIRTVFLSRKRGMTPTSVRFAKQNQCKEVRGQGLKISCRVITDSWIFYLGFWMLIALHVWGKR